MQRKKYYDLYELYTREEMSEIANKEGFLFVETSNGDNYETVSYTHLTLPTNSRV